MNLEQTFSRIAFYQVLLGILTFCYAEANPGMLLIAGSLVVLSRYVSEGPWGRPLPWWIINMLAVVATTWMFSRFLLDNPNMIVTMGHFTMALQVLLMFTRKSNREYGQVLLLSLLQMIGASVLSVSIIYGLMLGVYCILAMLTVLIFHLKSSSDRVYEANRTAAADKNRVTRPKQVTGKGFYWQFRSATAIMMIGCAIIAVMVFILVPRSPDASLAADATDGLGPRQVGFSQQVRLDGPPIAQGSKEPVMNLRVELNGQPQMYRSWLLRGAALDTYDPESHTWKRSQQVSGTDRRIRMQSSGLSLAQVPNDRLMLDARITLRQIGHRNLFTILPVTHFHSDSIRSVIFSNEDQQLSAGSTVMGAVIYDISWPFAGGQDEVERYQELGEPNETGGPVDRDNSDFRPEVYARGWTIQAGRIASLANEVLEKAGLQRDPMQPYTSEDDRIVQALATYLRDPEHYRYELGGNRHFGSEEPTIDFLFEHRTGHCELFASALAAMTRSIGMQSRVVTGFRASEYNQIGGYYVVRQSDAHAWVEVNLGPGQGWHSYDATPAGTTVHLKQPDRTWKIVLREAYEYMEFGWIRSVVAYDVSTRHALLSGIMQKLRSLFYSEDNFVGQSYQFVKNLPTAWELDKVNTGKVLGSAAVALIITVLLIRSIITRRRRVAVLKLTGLSTDQKLNLVRQLSFYVDMIDLLTDHGYPRSNTQNPRDFALGLINRHPQDMQPVLTLTDIFYRVRFGGVTLDTEQRKQVREHLRQLQHNLSNPQTV